MDRDPMQELISRCPRDKVPSVEELDVLLRALEQRRTENQPKKPHN